MCVVRHSRHNAPQVDEGVGGHLDLLDIVRRVELPAMHSCIVGLHSGRCAQLEEAMEKIHAAFPDKITTSLFGEGTNGEIWKVVF